VGVDEITRATRTPLGDYLWGVYFGILNIFGISRTRVFFLNLSFFFKILKIFITLLHYRLPKKFAKIMSFSKKN
jgi:hypothetical protein